jgi:hypothetical protein
LHILLRLLSFIRVNAANQTANAAAGLQMSSSTKGFAIQTTQFGGQQADIEIVDITGKTIKVLSGKNLSNGVTYIPLDISDGAILLKS